MKRHDPEQCTGPMCSGGCGEVLCSHFVHYDCSECNGKFCPRCFPTTGERCAACQKALDDEIAARTWRDWMYEAESLSQQAARIEHDNATVERQLRLAKIDEAVAALQKAREMVVASGHTQVAA